MAQSAGFDLATYGGTSREIIEFIRTKSNELGGIQAYNDWLNATKRIHLFDWHRMNSDLDIMIVTGETGPPPNSVKTKLQDLTSKISEEFPGNIFFKKLDVQVAEEFLRDARYRPDSEHFEAISNIPIGRKGILELKDLNVETKAGPKNLARWGANQFLTGAFEFELNPKLNASDPGFAKLKQALRWIR